MAKLLGIFVGMAGLTASLFYAANLGGSQTSAQGVLSRDAMTEIALAEEKKTDSTGLPDAPSIRDANATAAGAVELIGVAPPDADVTLLVNEKPSGVQKAGADGKWTFSLELPDKTAEQTLSVQVKDAKGMAFAVAERVKVVPGEGGNPPKLTLLMQDGSERVLQSGVAQETGLIVERAETAPGGKVLLAGRGDADMIVKALIGGQSIGEAKVDKLGQWRIEGPAKASGTLRIDLVDAGGKTKDRVDLPFTVAGASEQELAAARDAEEAAKKAEQDKKAEDDKKAAEASKAEEDKKAAELKKAEEDKKAAEAKKAEEEKKAAEAKKAEEEKKAAELKKAEEDKKAAEAKKAEEDKKAAELKKAEEDKKAAELKKAEEDKKAAELKKAEEDKKAAEELAAKEAKAKADIEKAMKAQEAKEAADKAKAAADAAKTADAAKAREADKTAAVDKAKTEGTLSPEEVARAERLAADAAKKAAADAAGAVSGAINPGTPSGTIGKAVDAVAKAVEDDRGSARIADRAKSRTAAAKVRGTKGGSSVEKSRRAHRQFVTRYVRMTEVRTIRVRRGESLWDIAERTYGDGEAWREIARQNRRSLRNPNLIAPGQVLRIRKTVVKRVAVPAGKKSVRKVRRPRAAERR